MGLENITFEALINAASLIPSTGQPKKLLALGYPDLLVDEPTLRNAGLEPTELKTRSDALIIQQWHSWAGPIYDTDDVLGKLGITAMYVDINPSRLCERVVDLNEPLPTDLCNSFDLVVDPGTIEHCFNIGQSFKNVALALKVGGIVLHQNPLTCMNHGFWNFSPTAYFDFYYQNGFQILRPIVGFNGKLNERAVYDAHAVQRFKIGQEAWSMCIAQKKTEQELKWPLQSKYRLDGFQYFAHH